MNLHSLFARRPRAVLGLGIALALLLALTGASYVYRDAWMRPATPTDKLVIAVPMLPHTSLLLIAEANGYFIDEGLEVVIKPVSHGK